MNKTTDNIIDKLHNVILNINKTIEEENFSAYYRIKESCLESVNLVNEHKFNEASKEISFSIHLIMEAPPKNHDIGNKIIFELQAIYELIIQLIH